jgi:two-component system response regulator YesN
VVDDEELVRNAITTIIDWDTLGFSNIYQAEDGLEALELCRKQKIDLVLTDIVMPFMDGLELSSALKHEFPDIHVVILTGHEDFEYAKQSVDLGVKNYILKPVGASTLYVKMKEICKKLNIEASQKQYIAKMRSQIYQSMPILQEKFYTHWFVHSMEIKRIQKIEFRLWNYRCSQPPMWLVLLKQIYL